MPGIPNHSAPVYISSAADFTALCKDLELSPLLALDSEFIRTNSFFPKPGLIQLANEDSIYLVDPLAVTDWHNFRKLIAEGSTTTLMHSCSEDLSLLQHMMQSVPVKLFDTQRAAAFLGHGYSVSYQALVQSELDIEVPKGETRSDWLRRPLSESQLSYAALDVAYLEPLHDLLKEKLIARGLLDWFEQDCVDLLLQVKDETSEDEWGNAYKNIGAAWKLTREQLIFLQKLCYWREATARNRDKPRNWILKDNELLSLATFLGEQDQSQELNNTATRQMIEDSNVLSVRFAQREAAGIADFLNQEREFVEIADSAYLDKPLSSGYRKKLKACQNVAKQIAEDFAIAPELVARKRQWLELMSNVIRGQENIWPSSMDNWRRQELESKVIAIIHSNAG